MKALSIVDAGAMIERLNAGLVSKWNNLRGKTRKWSHMAEQFRRNVVCSEVCAIAVSRAQYTIPFAQDTRFPTQARADAAVKYLKAAITVTGLDNAFTLVLCGYEGYTGTPEQQDAAQIIWMHVCSIAALNSQDALDKKKALVQESIRNLCIQKTTDRTTGAAHTRESIHRDVVSYAEAVRVSSDDTGIVQTKATAAASGGAQSDSKRAVGAGEDVSDTGGNTGTPAQNAVAQNAVAQMVAAANKTSRESAKNADVGGNGASDLDLGDLDRLDAAPAPATTTAEPTAFPATATADDAPAPPAQRQPSSLILSSQTVPDTNRATGTEGEGDGAAALNQGALVSLDSDPATTTADGASASRVQQQQTQATTLPPSPSPSPSRLPSSRPVSPVVTPVQRVADANAGPQPRAQGSRFTSTPSSPPSPSAARQGAAASHATRGRRSRPARTNTRPSSDTRAQAQLVEELTQLAFEREQELRAAQEEAQQLRAQQDAGARQHERDKQQYEDLLHDAQQRVRKLQRDLEMARLKEQSLQLEVDDEQTGRFLLEARLNREDILRRESEARQLKAERRASSSEEQVNELHARLVAAQAEAADRGAVTRQRASSSQSRRRVTTRLAQPRYAVRAARAAAASGYGEEEAKASGPRISRSFALFARRRAHGAGAGAGAPGSSSVSSGGKSTAAHTKALVATVSRIFAAMGMEEMFAQHIMRELVEATDTVASIVFAEQGVNPSSTKLISALLLSMLKTGCDKMEQEVKNDKDAPPAAKHALVCMRSIIKTLQSNMHNGITVLFEDIPRNIRPAICMLVPLFVSEMRQSIVKALSDSKGGVVAGAEEVKAAVRKVVDSMKTKLTSGVWEVLEDQRVVERIGHASMADLDGQVRLMFDPPTEAEHHGDVSPRPNGASRCFRAPDGVEPSPSDGNNDRFGAHDTAYDRSEAVADNYYDGYE